MCSVSQVGAASRIPMFSAFAAVATVSILIVGCAAPTVPVTTASFPQVTSTPLQTGSPTAPPPSIQPSPTLQPTDSPTPSPTPTAVPTATPTPAAGIFLDAAEIARHLDALAAIADENGGTRAPDGPGYDASADYVASELGALGFEVDRQGVDFASFHENSVTLEIGNRSWLAPEWIHANIYSANGQSADVVQTVGISDGQPTATSGCVADDWHDFDAGLIAVVFGGVCSRRQVILLAQEAFAGGLISLYPAWERGRVLQPTLLDPDGLHTLAVVAGREPAEALLDAAATGAPVTLAIDVEHRA